MSSNNPNARATLIPFTKETAAEMGAKGGTNKKGSKHINTWVQQLLQDDEFEAQIRQGLRIVDYKGAPLPAIIKAQITKALDGDTKAYDSLVKSGWTQKQEIEHTGQINTGISDPVMAAEFAEFLKNKTKE